MAYSSLKLNLTIIPSSQRITCPSLQIRAHHSHKDEGLSRNLVDANLSILKQRIEIIKMREKLENCCRCEMGWNYATEYTKKPKICEELLLFGWAIGSFGLTIASGTLGLSLVSLLVYLHQ